jgi:CheY-like chemotaxis protein
MAGESILIVDDNATNLKLVRLLLQSAGYDVHIAADAEQAIEVLKNFHPQLILMDIQLPGMDGLELTRRLKAGVETRKIKIVALTAYAMKGDENKMLEAGCDGYISKPVDTRTLPVLIKEYLNRGKAAGA